ncbi:hypothetical protein ACS0TY_027465 [Phlomoides rotata]
MQKLFTIAVGVIYSAKDIFCLRERDLVNRFASEISRYEVQGESKESAFMAIIKDENIYQPPCLILSVYNFTFFVPRSYQLAEDLGRAFADRVILQTFIEAENSVTVASLKNMLSVVRSVYVVVTLDEEAAFLRYVGVCLAEDPFNYFDLELSYITASPLGIPQ